MCLTLFTPRVKNVKIGALPTKSVGQQNANGKNAPDVCRALASLFFLLFVFFLLFIFCFLSFVFVCVLSSDTRSLGPVMPIANELIVVVYVCMYVCRCSKTDRYCYFRCAERCFKKVSPIVLRVV